MTIGFDLGGLVSLVSSFIVSWKPAYVFVEANMFRLKINICITLSTHSWEKSAMRINFKVCCEDNVFLSFIN